MRSYPFIRDLFQGILNNSKTIQGRFFILHKYGLQDINYDELGQVFNAIPLTKKYPLVALAPPHAAVKFSGKDDGWKDFRMTMFFMKESYKEDISSDTRTSLHTIPDDWHDMSRCADNFLRVLIHVNRSDQRFIFKRDHNTLFIPLSQIGADRISGVRIDFDFKLHIGCNLEDYDEYPDNLEIIDDGHPEHII